MKINTWLWVIHHTRACGVDNQITAHKTAHAAKLSNKRDCRWAWQSKPTGCVITRYGIDAEEKP